MTSTLNRKETSQNNAPHPSGYAQNGGTHIPLGSEGSSRDSELSSGGELEGQLPETVDIEIVLPDKNIKCLTVDYGKQMMDLLVQVTASMRLSPATHTFQLFSEETGRIVEYYASQPVGSLGITTFYLVEKKTELQKKKERQSAALTFERTQRLTVNLPKNQKMITRVSPKCTLADIYKMVCSEKNLDPYKYELRHPTKPDEALNMASPLGDYQLVEITVVTVGPESRHSVSRLSIDSTDLNDSRTTAAGAISKKPPQTSSFGDYSSSTMEKKKKKGIFSLFSKKKEGKFKISEATYNESSSTLPSSGLTVASSSHVSNNYTTQSSSKLRDQPQKTSKKSSQKKRDSSLKNIENINEDNNNVSSVQKGKQQQIPPKPPRKKRQAPPPPSHLEGGLVINTSPQGSSVNEQDLNPALTKVHSRESSHSSGFESAGSPLESPGTSRGGESSVAIESQPGDSLRAAKVTQSKDTSVRPKEPSAGTRKKRRAPAPPDVSRLRVGSESSDATTPISTPRENTEQSQPHSIALAEDEGAQISMKDDSALLIKSQSIQRPNPVFMPPPPPDTPPPTEEILSVPTIPPPPYPSEVEVADSSTQVHVTNRDSLSSAITGSRLSSVSSEPSVISESLELENPVYIEPNRKSDVAEFVDQMAVLTEQIDVIPEKEKDIMYIENVQEDENVGLSPRSVVSEDHSSFAKDSLHSSSSETASVDNYDFGVPDSDKDIEPALPMLDTSVVLLKKKNLQEDSFYSNDTFNAENSTSSNLAESQDSGIGSLTKPPKEFEDTQVNQQSEKLKVEEETSHTVEYITEESVSSKSNRYHSSGSFGGNDENADKYSVDSLDILETPASDSGISGESGSLERENNKNKNMTVTEEITIDQSEVMYVAPGGPKPDIEDEKKIDSAQIIIEKQIENHPKENNQPTQSEVKELDTDTSQTTATDHNPQTLIIEKPKLSHEISSAMKQEEKVAPQKATVNVTNYENMNNPELNKLMSYVVSAKMKSEEREVPVSPGAESKQSSSFFVDLGENQQKKSTVNTGLHSRSLDSFGNQEFSYFDPSFKSEGKPSVTITTLEYKSDKPFEGMAPKGGKDTYQKPVSSLREAYGKTVNKEPVFTIRSSVQSKTPAYSFYRTVERDNSPSGRRSKEPVESKKRHSTLIMAQRGEKVDTSRHQNYYMGPRPWGGGRQNSEPSVRDVRKALALNEQKQSSGQDSPLNREVEDIITKSPIKEQCSKIGFSPHSEQESDSVLEEKSISQINLPAERKSVIKDKQQYRPKSNVQLSTIRSESMDNLNTLGPRSPTNKVTKSTENVFDATFSAREKSRKTLQSQYDDLQQQFAKWQQQLMDNQAILSKRSSRTIGSLGTSDADTVSNLRADRPSNSKLTSQFDRRRTVDVVESTGEILRSGHQPLTETQSLETNKTESRRIHQGPRYGSLTEGVPRMGTSAALGSRFTSDELAQARHKLRQNNMDESKVGSSMRFNADGTSTRVSRSSYGSSLNSEPTSPGPMSSLPKHSTPLKEGHIPPSHEPNALDSASPGVSLGYHRREQTRRYGAQSNRRRSGGTQSSTSTSPTKSTPKNTDFEPKLDPREELMIAIRNAGGRTTLRKVAVAETHWVQGTDTTSTTF